MNKRIEYILAAIICLPALTAIVSSFYYEVCHLKDVATYVAGVAVFCFFLYKLITGWLIINLSINTEVDRTKDSNKKDDDHLAVKVILSKGSIDSLWLEDIEIRISCISKITNREPTVKEQIIKPLNFKKLDLKNFETAEINYWSGTSKDHYVLSTGEETAFSAYARISPGFAYSSEIVVIGYRPFYSLTTQKHKKIQWRASIIVLPLCE